jgi:hypothetical protein
MDERPNMIILRLVMAGGGIVLIVMGLFRTGDPGPLVETVAPASTTVTLPVASTSVAHTANTTIPTTTGAPGPTASTPARSRSNAVSARVATTAAPTPSTTSSLPPQATTVDDSSDLVRREYGMYERNGDVLQLQMVLGLRSVDGIYGPVTRAAHMEFLGGPYTALGIFYPEVVIPGHPARNTETLAELVDRYFQSDDRAWALRVAFCESSALPHHTGSNKVSSALAAGWFQHMARFWTDRSTAAGWSGYSVFDSEANVAVAAHLLYRGGGTRHWNPSRTCWEAENGTH